jgi:hypothetical protein
MDYYMKIELDEGAITSKCCPRCKTLIRHSKRYGNILRQQVAEVMKVKRIVFGNEKLVKKRQSKLISEIYGNQVWVTVSLSDFQTYIVNLLATVVKSKKFLFFEVDKEKICVNKVRILSNKNSLRDITEYCRGTKLVNR